MKRQPTNKPYDDMSLRVRPTLHVLNESPTFWTALYTSPHGFVWMEGERNDHRGRDGITRLWFVWGGQEHMRTHEAFYGARWAARLAKKLVEEVTVQP